MSTDVNADIKKAVEDAQRLYCETYSKRQSTACGLLNRYRYIEDLIGRLHLCAITRWAEPGEQIDNNLLWEIRRLLLEAEEALKELTEEG